MSVPIPARTGTVALATLGLAAAAGHAAVVTSSPQTALGVLAIPIGSPASKITLVDVNADSVNDFSFTHSTNGTQTPAGKTDANGKLTLDAATASQFLAIVKDADGVQSADFNGLGYIGNYAETLPVGAIVGPSSALISLAAGGGYDDRLLDSSNDGDGGAFSASSGERSPSDPFGIGGGGEPAYVGFKLGSNYGYLEFTDIGDDTLDFLGTDFNAATLAGIAFETTPDTAITVGPITVPEPTSLATLAGVGLLTIARRRRRA